MFWGLVLEPSKKYTQKVDQTFHISQAALDLKSCDQEPIQLVVEYENSNFVLATLSKKANIFQVPLDLIFKTGDQVSFRTIGNGKIHLSGYHVLEDLDSMMLNGEEESDLEELEEEEDANEEEENAKGKGKRKKPTPDKKGTKKPKLGNEVGSDFDEDDDDDDDDDDEEDEDENDESDDDDDELLSNKKVKKKNGLIDDEAEEDDDLDDLDEDDFDTDDDDFDEDEDDDEIELQDSDEETTKKTPKSEKKKNLPQTPNGLSFASKEKNKSGQKLNKSKVETPGKTPKSENKAEKNKKNKLSSSVIENTPQRKEEEGLKNGEKNRTPKQQGVSPQKKDLGGGVIAEELRVGNGPVAKPGKMVNVYYVGTLQTTKKQFDSVQNGPGFKFRIGRNEVIKGWDIGVSGMKVGGKRRLTIPPHMAYGAKGSPPVIPPNSTLVFTVELKGVS